MFYPWQSSCPTIDVPSYTARADQSAKNSCTPRNLAENCQAFPIFNLQWIGLRDQLQEPVFFDSWELSLSKLPHLGINLPFRTDPCLLVVSSPIHPILGFVWICLQCLQSQQLSMFGWMPHGVKNWSSANQGYQWMVCNITVTLPPTNMTTLPRVGLEH